MTPCHKDPTPNFLCQVLGQKYVRLYSSLYDEAMYPCSGILRNTSQVDVESPDLSRFPLFSKAPYQDVILQPGETLFIPPGYWHYVRSLSVSISVSFWWTEQ